MVLTCHNNEYDQPQIHITFQENFMYTYTSHKQYILSHRKLQYVKRSFYFRDKSSVADEYKSYRFEETYLLINFTANDPWYTSVTEWYLITWYFCNGKNYLRHSIHSLTRITPTKGNPNFMHSLDVQL